MILNYVHKFQLQIEILFPLNLDFAMQWEQTWFRCQVPPKKTSFLTSSKARTPFLCQPCQDITTLDCTRGKVATSFTTEMDSECETSFYFFFF